MRFWTYFLVLLLLISSPSARAEDARPAQPGTFTETAATLRHTVARLVSPVDGVGDEALLPVALGLRFEQGWKTYWRAPGESGLAPVFDWTGSKNLKSATPGWPAPRRVVEAGLENYVYEEALIIPFDVVPETPGQPVSLNLKLDLLLCKVICVPETWNLALEIPAGPAAPNRAMERYRQVVRSLPQKDPGVFTRAFLNYDSANIAYLVVEAKADTHPDSGADLFVEHGSGLSFGRPSIAWDSAARQAVFTTPLRSNKPLAALEAALSATPLTLTWTNGGARAVEGTVTLVSRPEGSPPVSPQGLHARMTAFKTLGVLELVLVAFLGGLILNLMPCVLPVLSLKILSILSHGGKNVQRRKIFTSFMATSVGILAAFWVMAGALAALKGAGQAVGWGIQFQSPVFLAVLIAVVLAFAANMWGLFEIPLPRFIARNIPARHEHEPTLAGHFLSGVFATVLATPCSAPFLGTAVGFGLSQGALEIFAVFTMIGLGLASPYLVLAASPGMFRFLPRPGKWMLVLKKALALALVLTATWLASVLVTITKTPALAPGWQKFDAALIAPAVQEGKVVMVDVTADWCLTCKANKRLVFAQDEVAEALSGPEILRLQADWTHRDAKIGDFLKDNGRYGIPFDIVYGPAVPNGIPLPELLTKKAVLNALAEAAGE